MYKKLTLMVLAGLVLAAPNVGRGEEKDPKAVRAKYAKKECKVLAITEPIEVTKMFYWKDGGSIGITLTDSKKVEHSFALDGREGKAGNLFLNATHPSRKEAKEVKAKGEEEQELYGLLLRWVEKHPRKEALYDEEKELKDDKQPWLWEFRAFFLRLDRRFTK